MNKASMCEPSNSMNPTVLLALSIASHRGGSWQKLGQLLLDGITILRIKEVMCRINRFSPNLHDARSIAHI